MSNVKEPEKPLDKAPASFDMVPEKKDSFDFFDSVWKKPGRQEMYNCDLCPKTYTNLQEAKRCKDEHRVYPCNICEDSFMTRLDLDNHKCLDDEDDESMNLEEDTDDDKIEMVDINSKEDNLNENANSDQDDSLAVQVDKEDLINQVKLF